jgi:hypothetical protein
MPRLENWSVICLNVNPYMAPEGQEKQLHGEVFDHPGFEDGEVISTSAIINYDADGKTVRTSSGSVYTLGKISEEYEALYPDASSRMFPVRNPAN